MGVSIQSKLLLMLLGVSLLAAVVAGAVGYVNGRNSLRDAAFEQLTSIREMRAEELTRTFQGIQAGVILDSRNDSAVGASEAFNAGFEELKKKPLDPALSRKVDDYYVKTFVPQLEKRSGMQYDATALEPNTDAGRYLQSQYTIPFDDFDKSLEFNDAGDGTAWSAAHAKYHDYFKSLVKQTGYEDMLMLNTDGDVVYTAYKGVDLGVNIEAAPYKDSALAKAYEDVMKTNTVDTLVTTDFERYIPSLNVPTAWIVSPVGTEDHITGAMGVQIPVDTINNVMTGNETWAKQGLGKTGEVYLAGPDKLMRSVSRELIQNPKDYVADVTKNGTSKSVAQRVVDVKGTVLLQPANTTAVNAALKGETGTSVGRSYLGGENLAAYAPLELDGVQWAIVARIDSSEAFAPVNAFARTLALSTAAVVFFIALLSMLLAQVFIRPLRRLMGAVQRVAAGDRDVEVDTRSRDEFGELGAAFNDMSRSLQIKADLLEEQQAENQRLLLTLMPEKVAERYRQGDETIAEDHKDVTVIYADIVGFDEFSAGLPSEEGLAVLNDIVRSFDDVADTLGVERVRTTKQGYLASCGLIVPRVDSARRVVDFAMELERVLQRIGAQRGAKLSLRAGIDSGTVTSGLVGRSSVVYDMWGDAVSLAYRLQGRAGESGIYVTQQVVDRLGDSVALADAGEVESKQGPQRFWRLETGAGRG